LLQGLEPIDSGKRHEHKQAAKACSQNQTAVSAARHLYAELSRLPGMGDQ
jgi:hypothetical protein